VGNPHAQLGAFRCVVATAVDPHLKVRISGTDTDWTAELIEADAPASELPEVLVAKVSRGAVFQFEPRRSLPLTVKRARWDLSSRWRYRFGDTT
ncbi:hypothetical protein OVV29_34720, partial [Klebsiella pneumoniae]|nr:hypothetical protein [Klebsiella pneumoniae]